jgi:hypothetical protein
MTNYIYRPETTETFNFSGDRYPYFEFVPAPAETFEILRNKLQALGFEVSLLPNGWHQASFDTELRPFEEEELPKAECLVVEAGFRKLALAGAFSEFGSSEEDWDEVSLENEVTVCGSPQYLQCYRLEVIDKETDNLRKRLTALREERASITSLD